MSADEFEKYKNGNKLINYKFHNGKTNSVGFCFVSCEDFSPEEAMHFLSGVVNFDICAIFEVDKKLLHKTYGIYAEPLKKFEENFSIEELINTLQGNGKTIKIDEYCTTFYNKSAFKLIKYSQDIWNQWNPFEMQKELKWEENNNE
jgi:hypothetical protein